MILVIYIIGFVIVFSFGLYMFTEPGPKNNREAIVMAAWMLCLMTFWPVALIVVLLATLLKWVSGNYE